MINRLVVNGCSYLFNYNGVHKLANNFSIEHAINLAKPGSCNSRIIRTTLQDSYNSQPTLYVVGLTFLTRYELPVGINEEEGKWVSFNGKTVDQPNLDHSITGDHLMTYSKLWDRFNCLSLPDIAFDLQFRVLSMIDSLQHRGHKVVVFNTAEQVYEYFLSHPKFDPLRQTKNIIQGLEWRSVPWQFERGARFIPDDIDIDPASRHVNPDDYRWLNEFLTNYITEYKILE